MVIKLEYLSQLESLLPGRGSAVRRFCREREGGESWVLGLFSAGEPPARVSRTLPHEALHMPLLFLSRHPVSLCGQHLPPSLFPEAFLALCSGISHSWGTPCGAARGTQSGYVQGKCLICRVSVCSFFHENILFIEKVLSAPLLSQHCIFKLIDVVLGNGSCILPLFSLAQVYGLEQTWSF